MPTEIPKHKLWFPVVTENCGRWHPSLQQESGNECWVDGCNVDSQDLAIKIAMNMAAAFREGWYANQKAVTSALKHTPIPMEGIDDMPKVTKK
jgi:hypothetical protein